HRDDDERPRLDRAGPWPAGRADHRDDRRRSEPAGGDDRLSQRLLADGDRDRDQRAAGAAAPEAGRESGE
ncbi:hypothetical protein QU38_00920, partial [Staphylococcus aureus]